MREQGKKISENNSEYFMSSAIQDKSSIDANTASSLSGHLL